MNKTIFGILILAVTIYLILPIWAGVNKKGGRSGPRVYIGQMHEFLYYIGWKFAGNEGKPRIGFWEKDCYRPWFYGMKSKNNDPEYIKKERDKLILKQLERAEKRQRDRIESETCAPAK